MILGWAWIGMDAQQKAHPGDTGPTVSVGEDPIMPDLDEAGREDVLEEAADELESGQERGYGPLGIAGIAASEEDGLLRRAGDAMIGDGDAMGIASEVVDDLPGAGEGFFAVGDPLLVVERSEEPIDG